MVQEAFIEFEVVQEYGGSGRERITLGQVKLNLAEYIEQSEFSPIDGDDHGITRRYLMQESKINSTLKLGIFMRQTEGDKNFIAPALKTAQVFSGIAGIMAGEQAELEDSGGGEFGRMHVGAMADESSCTVTEYQVARSWRTAGHVSANTSCILVCATWRAQSRRVYRRHLRRRRRLGRPREAISTATGTVDTVQRR